MVRARRCSSLTLAVTVVLCLVLVATLVPDGADASPWFDLFVGGGGQQHQRPRSYYPYRSPTPRSRSGRDKYKEICRTINPDNYAFPGRLPYPSAPLCPY